MHGTYDAVPAPERQMPLEQESSPVINYSPWGKEYRRRWKQWKEGEDFED